MIPALSFVFMFISLVISVVMPVALIIWVVRRHHTGFAPVAVGFLVFFVTQMVVRTQLINGLSLIPTVQAFIVQNPVLYIIILSFSAGIFEEFGRLFGFSVMLKHRRELRHGVAYGIGHGGIEAVLLVGASYVSNIIFASMINSGSMDSLTQLLPGIAGNQLSAIQATLVSTPPVTFLLGGLERIFAIALHIALSVLVLYGVRTKHIRFTFIAILAHGLVNFGAVMLGQYVNIWISEAFMLVVAVLCIIFVRKMRAPFKEQDPPPSSAMQMAA